MLCLCLDLAVWRKETWKITSGQTCRQSGQLFRFNGFRKRFLDSETKVSSILLQKSYLRNRYDDDDYEVHTLLFGDIPQHLLVWQTQKARRHLWEGWWCLWQKVCTAQCCVPFRSQAVLQEGPELRSSKWGQTRWTVWHKQPGGENFTNVLFSVSIWLTKSLFSLFPGSLVEFRLVFRMLHQIIIRSEALIIMMQKSGRWKSRRALLGDSCWRGLLRRQDAPSPMRGLRIENGSRNKWNAARMEVRRRGIPKPTAQESLMVELL